MALIKQGGPTRSRNAAIYHSGPAAPVRTLADILEATADRHPHEVAIDDGQTVMNYLGLIERVAALADRLGAEGIGAGDRIGIRLPSGRAELYVAILAVLRAGAAYVPVDADDPYQRAELIWAEAGVCGVLVDGHRLIRRAEISPSQAHRAPDPEDEAWIIFTSGSTGRPKGVAVSHRAAAAFVDAEARLFAQAKPLGPTDRVLAGLSVGFDASCEEMWLAWRHGACLVPAPRELVRTGADLGPWLIERGITVVSTVPTLAALWPGDALANVRLLILGGETVTAELATRVDVAGREVWNTYGPTEATVVSSAARLSANEPVRIGRPLDGWELAVIDKHGHPVNWGEVGELIVAGVGLARYLDPIKDATSYAPLPQLGWSRGYRSGDLVRAEPEGLVFVGRVDDQVKVGGRRVELGEVDAALLSLPDVVAAATVLQRTAVGGQVMVGYLVLADGVTELESTEARALLHRRLPASLVPTLVVLSTLPTRSSGKVDRDALPWPLPTAGPRELNGTAGFVAEHWAHVLGVSPGTGSHFFDSGGSSLAAAQLVAGLRRRHPQIAVADLYQHPTLADLADRLDTLPPAATNDGRTVRPTSRLFGLLQVIIAVLLYGFSGLRWVVGAATVSAVLGLVGGDGGVSLSISLFAVAGWLLLLASPGRVVLAAGGARLLTSRLRAGTYRRGGPTHLRLWAAERWVTAVGVTGLAGTVWARSYARALGCRVGRAVDLQTAPPVTGLASFGDHAAVEPAANLAGWWVDGNELHVGSVELGPRARLGSRSTMLPGAVIGADAEVTSGSSVSGTVPAAQLCGGAPARVRKGVHDRWPQNAAHRSILWGFVYSATPLLTGLLRLSAILPGMLIFQVMLADGASLKAIAQAGLWIIPLAAAVSVVTYSTATVLIVRLASLGLRPGTHRVDSLTGWCTWLVQGATLSLRSDLFPLYASLFTPVWLRLLGARVGRHTEVSTVSGLPKMMSVGSKGFLADDSVLAPYELRAGWLRLGSAEVGDRAFVGNSAEVGPDRSVPAAALVGVLSEAPVNAEVGTSWLGRPATELPRTPDVGAVQRTFDPPRRLVAARISVEACRFVPVILTYGLAMLVYVCFSTLADQHGIATAVLASPAVMLTATTIGVLSGVASKWLLMGRFSSRERPLWNAFVWRNELSDVFYEELIVRWAGGMIGTPLFNQVLRMMGARIGRGVLCETRWLPEPDLIRLDDGAAVNRGCVLQTHLFHDRIMRLGPIRLRPGATLGPHTIALFDTTVEAGCTVGPNSLVMRGEILPSNTLWTGNPIRPWRTRKAN